LKLTSGQLDTIQPINTSASPSFANLTLSGGTLALNNVTSNIIAFNTGGYGFPTFDSRTIGTKLLLWPEVSSDATDYAIGIGDFSLWYSVPQQSKFHRWYAGTTLIATLSGTGQWTLPYYGVTGSTLAYLKADQSGVVSASSTGFASDVRNQISATGGVSYVAGTGIISLVTGSNNQLLSMVSGSPTWGQGPLTSVGDLLVGGTNGATGIPTRLPIGSSGQFVSVVNGVVQWGQGPLTSTGDLMVGGNGTGASATRLSIGSSGQLVSVVGGAVSWGQGPLTSAGDLMVGGAGGASSIPTRLAAGSVDQLLSVASSGVLGWKSLTGASGVTYTSSTGVISIGQPVGTGNSPQFAGATIGTLTGYVKATTGLLSAVATIPASDITGLTASVPISFVSGAITLAYNSTNLRITTNELNTIQDLGTGSSPLFASLSTTGPSGMSILGVGSRLSFPIGISGVNFPTFNTTSVGTKILFYPEIGVASSNYAMGMGSSTLWSCVPDSTKFFAWYGGISNIMTLAGNGILTLPAYTGSYLKAGPSGAISCSTTTFNSDVRALISATAPASYDSNNGTIGLAYNSSNLKITAGQLNTVQDIGTGGGPLFSSLSLVRPNIQGTILYISNGNGPTGNDQGAQIHLNNNYTLAVNPNKYIRVDVGGNFVLLNSAYSAAIFSVTDAGVGYLPFLQIGTLSGVLKASSGNVSGSATTSDLPQGSNLYFTNALARSALSVTGTNLSYDSNSGVFSMTGTPSFASIQTTAVIGLSLTNAGQNTISFPISSGVSAPTFNATSVGTKIIFYPEIGTASSNYSMGMATNTLWYGVPDTTKMHRWYGGTTIAMTLKGDGILTLPAYTGASYLKTDSGGLVSCSTSQFTTDVRNLFSATGPINYDSTNGRFSLTGSGYVASISGTTNQINVSANTGAVVLSLPSTVITSIFSPSSNIRMNNNPIYLSTGSDVNHFLRYDTSVDGPALAGWLGGALMSTGVSGATAVSLRWTINGVNIPSNSNLQLDNLNGAGYSLALDTSKNVVTSNLYRLNANVTGVGTTAVSNDANLPLQLNTTGGQLSYISFNRSGSPSVVIGADYVNGGFNSFVFRSLGSESMRFVSNSIQIVASITSSNDFVFDRLTADSLLYTDGSKATKSVVLSGSSNLSLSSGSLSVVSSPSFSGSLSVSGSGSFGSLYSSGLLSVSGSGSFGGSLSVSGSGSFGGSLSSSGLLSVSGSGVNTFSGLLNVSGLGSNVYSGSLMVSGSGSYSGGVKLMNGMIREAETVQGVDVVSPRPVSFSKDTIVSDVESLHNTSMAIPTFAGTTAYDQVKLMRLTYRRGYDCNVQCPLGSFTLFPDYTLQRDLRYTTRGWECESCFTSTIPDSFFPTRSSDAYPMNLSTFFQDEEQGPCVSISSDGSYMVSGCQATISGYDTVVTFQQTPETPIYTSVSVLTSNGTGWGRSVAISGDAAFLMIGAWDFAGQGAAFVYRRSGNSWIFFGRIDGNPGDRFGWSVASNCDGSTFAMGAPYVNGQVGEVSVYIRVSVNLVRQAVLTPIGGVGACSCGYSVALSATGDTLIAGGNTDNFGRGAAYIYKRSGTTWSNYQRVTSEYVSFTAAEGTSVAISADGFTIATGAPFHTYQDTDQITGATTVYYDAGSGYLQQAFLMLEGGSGGRQGTSISLSADGNSLAVGAPYYNDQRGAVWSFTRRYRPAIQKSVTTIDPIYTAFYSGFSWVNSSRIFSNIVPTPPGFVLNRIGQSVSYTANGNMLAVGGTMFVPTVGFQVFSWIFY